MIQRRVRLLVPLAITLGACDAGSALDPPDGPVDGPYVVLHVRGAVTTSAGAPVPNANVAVMARGPGSCAGAFAADTVAADSTGRFAVTLGTWNVPRDVCLWVAAPAPTGTEIVVLRPARLEHVADSVQVTLVLPPG
jgi:hypothetical protein